MAVLDLREKEALKEKMKRDLEKKGYVERSDFAKIVGFKYGSENDKKTKKEDGKIKKGLKKVGGAIVDMLIMF
jgi:hypothetical protein